MEKHTDQNVVLDVMGIMEILPHRYPMLLIDAVLDYEAGSFTIAKKLFSCNEAYFVGHYPQNPIVPGTVLLEGLSQAAAFTILSGEKSGERGNLLFTGVNKLRFFKVVSPGDCIIYKTSIIKNAHGFWSVSGTGTIDGQTCISSEMTFVKMR